MEQTYVVRIASRTASQLLPVIFLDYVPGVGGDADHAILAHGRGVCGLCVAPWVLGFRIVANLEDELWIMN